MLLSLFQRALQKAGRAAKTLFGMVRKLQQPDEGAHEQETLSEADQHVIDSFLRRNQPKTESD